MRNFALLFFTTTADASQGSIPHPFYPLSSLFRRIPMNMLKSNPPTHSIQLIREARGGSPGAADRLLKEIDPHIMRTAAFYSRSTGVDPEDLRQEMRLGVLIGLQSVDTSIGDPLYYLCLRGKWRLLEFIRRSRRHRSEQIDAQEVCGRERPELEVDVRCLVQQLNGSLAPQQRFILSGLLSGMRQDEMAQALGCTPANVAYHVRRIRSRLTSIRAAT